MSSPRLRAWVVAGWIVLVTGGTQIDARSEVGAVPHDLGLIADAEGRVLLGGKPFRGLGVNYYDAFVRSLGTGAPRDVEPGFRALARLGIPFVRFSAGGYWPVDWGLYRTNAAAHWERLDEVVRTAERTGVGLIPSLFWYPPTLSDLVGEPLDQWGRDGSATLRFMRTYTRDMVTRYKGSSAVWAWEFGNEFNLGADLPNAAEHRPPTPPGLGTPALRSARDDLSHDVLRFALAEFGQEVRRHDPRRLILSGNAFPRPSAWHQQREKSWAVDTREQWSEMLAGDNPFPIGSFTGRLYTPEDARLLPWAAEKARATRRPLFVGELGVSGPVTEASLARFRSALDALEAHDVPLAALWVYDFDGQRTEWNVTADNERAALLEQIAERQASWAGRP